MPASGTLFGVPVGSGVSAGEKRPKPRRRWIFRLLLAALILMSLAAAGYYKRSDWLPQAPVGLLASSDWIGNVSFIWNGAAVSEADNATLVIDDGAGPLHTFHLNRDELKRGWYQFHCRPGHVTGTLLAGESSDSVTILVRPETYLPESGISK